MSITGVKYVFYGYVFISVISVVWSLYSRGVGWFYPLYWCMGEFSGHQMNSPVRIEIVCYSRDTFYKLFCVQVWSYRIDKMFHAYLVSCWLFLSVSPTISPYKRWKTRNNHTKTKARYSAIYFVYLLRRKYKGRVCKTSV